MPPSSTPLRAQTSHSRQLIALQVVPYLLPVGLAIFCVAMRSPGAVLVWLTDGALALGVLLAAAGFGAWPACWLGERRTGLRQVCLALALGLGILSTLTLMLGVLGWVNRASAIGFLVVGCIVGLARWYLGQRLAAATDANEVVGSAHPTCAPSGGAWLRSLALAPLAVPLGIMLIGASLPPGILWREEAGGYDALEYHLQAPREYFDAGRIAFLPHNVYASFPQQTEMLYLLLMHLAGRGHAGAIPAQCLHALLGILTVVALAAWSPPGWPRCVAVLLGGGTPWLAYLGCLAYVENGLLFFAAAAAGMLLDALRTSDRNAWRSVLAAGICAGLCAASKYTGAALVAGALGAALLVATPGVARRVGFVLVFGVGALLAFSPWLIRNAVFTGNPVYPFAYEWFGGKDWSTEQAEQWAHGHRVAAENASVTGRIQLAAREMFGRGPWHGPLWFMSFLWTYFNVATTAAGGIALTFLSRWTARGKALLGVWLLAMLVIWVAFTHIPGRFAVPLVVPLVLLASGAADAARAWQRRTVAALAVLAGIIGAAVLWNQWAGHALRWFDRADVPIENMAGRTDVFVENNLINANTPPDANVWIVGDAALFYVDRRMHYSTVFNRDPLLIEAEGSSPGELVGRLRDRKITHVVFAWSEIERLRRTYGFPAFVTPTWLRDMALHGLRRIGEPPDPRAPAATEVYEVLPESR